MKRERAYVDNRRNKILEVMEAQPGIKVADLAKMFDISAVTVRRDLQYLEDNKKLIRFYGGAQVTEKKEQEQDEVKLYRDLIARYAATLVEDGDSIFINTSANAISMLQYIDKRNVTVITNNGRALNYEHKDGISVILTGGELRYPKEAMVGDFAIRNLQTVVAKKCFVGCSGFSEECGMTTEIATEVNINELMIKNVAKENYILADHTKIGKNSSFISCGIENIKNLITDEMASQEVIEQIRDRGVHVHIVKREDFGL